MIAEKVLALYDCGRVRRRDAVLSRASARSSQQIPTAQQIIPVQIRCRRGRADRDVRDRGRSTNTSRSEAEILAENLLPRNIAVQVLRALLENAASEQGARMSAMDSATRNAGEMIKKQTHDLQPDPPGP